MFCDRDIYKAAPSTEEGPTSISSRSGGFTEQGNFDPGFDVCVGVYQVAREHPSIQIFSSLTLRIMSLNVSLTLESL